MASSTLAPDHVGRVVAGLAHDDTFGGAAGRGAGGQAGAQAVAGVALGIQADRRGLPSTRVGLRDRALLLLG